MTCDELEARIEELTAVANDIAHSIQNLQVDLYVNGDPLNINSLLNQWLADLDRVVNRADQK